MARVAIPLTQMSLNAGVSAAGTAMDDTNQHELDLGGKAYDVVLHAVGGGADGTIHVLPGDNPPSLRAGLGTLDITLGTADDKFVYIESARFIQSDGKVHINVDSSMTGTLAAYRVSQAGIS